MFNDEFSIRNKKYQKGGELGWTNRQGLERQLVEAGDFDGWPVGATGESCLPDIAGKGVCETTKAESPAACHKKNNRTLMQHFLCSAVRCGSYE